MTSFLKKVEVSAAKISPRKPQKPVPARKAKKIKDRSAEGKPASKQTTFAKLRLLIPQIENKLQVADPFDITSPSWGQFFLAAAPDVIVALLWDLGHVTTSKDRMYLRRYFKQRVRNA